MFLGTTQKIFFLHNFFFFFCYFLEIIYLCNKIQTKYPIELTSQQWQCENIETVHTQDDDEEEDENVKESSIDIVLFTSTKCLFEKLLLTRLDKSIIHV